MLLSWSYTSAPQLTSNYEYTVAILRLTTPVDSPYIYTAGYCRCYNYCDASATEALPPLFITIIITFVEYTNSLQNRTFPCVQYKKLC